MGWRGVLPRLVLAAAGLLYVAIGAKFALTPSQAAAETGLSLAGAVAPTTMRAGLGGFPLGLAAVLVWCALSPARTIAGLRIAGAVTGVVLAVRLASAAADGVLAESARLLAPETVVVILTLWASALVRRGEMSTTAPAAAPPGPEG
jgi:hypothetical protein